MYIHVAPRCDLHIDIFLDLHARYHRLDLHSPRTVPVVVVTKRIQLYVVVVEGAFTVNTVLLLKIL